MNYLKINEKSTIAKESLAYALASTEWFQYFGFDVVLIPSEIIQKDSFLNYVSSLFRFRAGVLRLHPNTCYNWHTDGERGVSINMLLTPEVRSTCLFATGSYPDVQFSVEELVYEPDTFYVFNTQNEHMVVNYDKPRYLFSLEFELNNDNLNFEKLLAKLKKGP